MSYQERMRTKICLLGDGAVGKTSLIRRFVVDEFRDKYISTMGVKVMKKNVFLKNPQRDVTLMIWDIMGQQIFTPVFKRYFKGSDGVLIVCDITRKETLKHIESWLKEITDVTGTIPAVFPKSRKTSSISGAMFRLVITSIPRRRCSYPAIRSDFHSYWCLFKQRWAPPRVPGSL